MSLPLRKSLRLGSILQQPISVRIRPSNLSSSLPSLSSSLRLASSRNFSTSLRTQQTSTPSSDPTNPSPEEGSSSISPSSSESKPISFLPSPSQIYVVPYHKDRNQAIEKLKIGVRAQSALSSRSVWRGLAFAFTASYPSLFPSLAVSLIDIKAVYVPTWAVRCNIEVENDEGEDIALISKNAYFPGTSVAPLSQLLLQPALHHLPPTLAKYNPAEDLEQHGFEITPVPFDTSPFVLPSLLPSGPPLNLGELGKIEDPSTIRWNKLDAVPIYMPFYAAKFTIGTEGPDYSLLFDASSPEPKDCTMHFPSVPPLYTQERVRPLTVMAFKDNFVQRPTSPVTSPAFEFDLYPEPSAADLQTKQRVAGRAGMSRSFKLSSDLEDWLETEGTREELRKLSLAGPKGGKEEEAGRIVGW